MTGSISITAYDGDRSAVRFLFEEAEDSAVQLDAYLDDGDVLVARSGEDLVGHLQLVPMPSGEWELKNMAVLPAHQGQGIGRALVDAALARARAAGVGRMTVATGAADVRNLRFYQLCGFRFLSVERDAFTWETGYVDQIDVDGIPLLDRVWLSQAL